MKMRPEMKAGKDISAIIGTANKATTENHFVRSIETRATEVIIVFVNLEAFERIEIILTPLPDVSEDIMKTLFVRRQIINW